MTSSSITSAWLVSPADTLSHPRLRRDERPAQQQRPSIEPTTTDLCHMARLMPPANQETVGEKQASPLTFELQRRRRITSRINGSGQVRED